MYDHIMIALLESVRLNFVSNDIPLRRKPLNIAILESVVSRNCLAILIKIAFVNGLIFVMSFELLQALEISYVKLF